jgi:hypothetical protein
MAEAALQRLAAAQRSEFFGKYRGQVVDNDDPEKRGRLKVLVPQVLHTVEVWALPCVPFAGKDQGLYAMPEEGTGVWVEFEAGDPSFPIWVGTFWGKGDIESADANPKIKFFKTRKFTLRINDGDGEVIIENEGGTRLKLTAIELLLKSSTVTCEGSGGKKTELSAVSYNVNNGTLEVL